MKKLFTLFIIIFATIASQAQVQPGYVKSIGRPDAPGKPLEGVLLRAKGAHNHIISAADGTFQLPLPNIKPGEAYSLQQIRKSGYELCEQGIIGRNYAFSDSVPLAITMLSTAQLQADKQRIEENAYRAAEKNYKKQLAALEHSKENNLITIEEYRAQMQALVDGFEKYQNLIDALSDHYARADYDNLDTTEREINLCIEQGELDRADSLLHTIFDPAEFIARNQAKLEQLNTTIDQAQTMLTQANADLAAVLRRQEKDAEYLYHLYTIALARFDNEKARFYIETRAELDTTNYKWQFGAAKFIYEYVADYNKAMEYYNRALVHAMEQQGENSEEVATCYNNIALIHEKYGNYSKALELHNKSLAINLSIVGENHQNTAICYNYIAKIYLAQDDFEKALELHKKSLAIHLDIFSETHLYIADCYNYIAEIYYNLGNYYEALELFEKSLMISQTISGKNNTRYATCCNNIAMVYHMQGEFDTALELYQKAVSVDILMYGNIHPKVATIYNNIGRLYSEQSEYKKALEMFNKSLMIRLTIWGENNLSVAQSYNNTAIVYYNQGDYVNALEMFNNALNIRLLFWGEHHSLIAESYNNIACVYEKQGDYKKALDFHKKSLKTRIAIYGDTHPEVATSYNNLAGLYCELEEYIRSIELYNKALQILITTFGNCHPYVAIIYESISTVYSDQGEYLKSLEYLTKSYDCLIKNNPNGLSRLNEVNKKIDFLKTKVNN